MTETYRTVAGRGEAAFSVRGSRFIGQVAPAASVTVTEEFIAAAEDEYEDATHNVPAYRVRAEPLREYASDDGEPGGSAGKPALTVLQRENIENVVAVITRYYGGTNLGTGGLARAYARAVKLALENASTVEERPHEQAIITVAYADSGTVQGILESTGTEFEATYEERVAFRIVVPVAETEALFDRVLSATSGRADIETADETCTNDSNNEFENNGN